MWAIEEGTGFSLLCFKKQMLQSRKKKTTCTTLSSCLILKGRVLYSKPVREPLFAHSPACGEVRHPNFLPQCHGNKVKVNKTTSVGQRQEGVVFFGVWYKVVSGHLSDRFVGAVWEQQLEKTWGNRWCCWVSAQTLPWLTCSAWAAAVAPVGGSAVVSALLQECTSHHPSCFPRLLHSPGMAYFRLLCVGESIHASVYAPFFFFFFLTLCSLTSKCKLSSHQLVFDLPLRLQACSRRNIKARNG